LSAGCFLTEEMIYDDDKNCPNARRA